MNDEAEIEKLLKAMKPAATTLDLRDRVGADLDLDSSWAARVHRAPRWAVAAGWAGMGAAAAIAVMGLLSGVAEMTHSAAGQMAGGGREGVPGIRSERRILDARDGGEQRAADESLEQHVQIWSVERHAWIDPRDGAEITVEIPRGETVVLPVQDKR